MSGLNISENEWKSFLNEAGIFDCDKVKKLIKNQLFI